MSTDPAWTTVIAATDAARIDLVADRLWAHGPAAVEERDLAGRPTLLAGYPSPALAAAAAADLRATGWADVEVAAVADDGLDAWRVHARVERAGPFVIVPAWLPVPPVADHEQALIIDPARTFGSGSHPTSRLVLTALAADPPTGATVLDVGTGSGILAVAAARLGATAVTAIDIDPGAPDAVRANAAANAVTGLTATATPLADLAAAGRRYDVVLANLLAPVLVDLAGDLAAVTTDRLLVSGLLADRWAETTDRLVAQGLTVVDVATDDDWAAVTLQPG